MKYPEDYINKIICGDCQELIKNIPDKSIDIILTDPPYGMDYQSAWRTEWQRKEKIHGDKEFPLWIFDEFKRIAKVGYFVFCRWDNLKEIPNPKSFIVWDKQIHGMGDLEHEFGRRWEGCAFYPQEHHKFKKRPVDVISVQRVSPNDLTHPNEKPVALLNQILGCHEIKTVLDPFCGSGSTLVACKELGIDYIGIEISKKYCEIAKRRLAQEYLFTNSPSKE